MADTRSPTSSSSSSPSSSCPPESLLCFPAADDIFTLISKYKASKTQGWTIFEGTKEKIKLYHIYTQPTTTTTETTTILIVILKRYTSVYQTTKHPVRRLAPTSERDPFRGKLKTTRTKTKNRKHDVWIACTIRRARFLLLLHIYIYIYGCIQCM